MAADIEALERRATAMISARSGHETVVRDCFLHSWPMRAHGFAGEEIDSLSGKTKRADLLDSTSTDSGNVLVASIVGGMTPASQRWFGLYLEGVSEAAQAWLDERAEWLWTNIHQANFDAVAPEFITDVIGGGLGGMYVDVDRESGGFSFEWWAAGTLYVAASKPGGQVDIVLRRYKLSAEQCVSQFGEEMVSTDVRKLAQDKPDELVELRRMIYPRRDRKPGSQFASQLPFASCTWEVSTRKLVRESGYHEFPVMAPRWSLLPNSHYAVGPMFDALPDIKQLNDLVSMENAAIDLAVSGMWIAEDDGVLNAKSVKVGPRKVIVANSVDSMKELKSGSDFNVSFTKKDQLQGAVRRTLMADQLAPPTDPRMTATEWLGRVAMLRQMLGPRFGRFQSEWLQPLVVRCFGLALREGVLGPLPDELRGRAAQVQYISPLARSQKLEEVAAMDRFEADIGAKVQLRPDVADLYDWDAAQRHKAKLLGVPLRLLPDARQVKALREARAKQQQQAQQQALVQGAAESFIDAGAQRMAQA